MTDAALLWIAAAGALLTLAAAIAAARFRTLFACAAAGFACAANAALCAAALGAPEIAAALIAAGAGLAFLNALGATLLTARAAKRRKILARRYALAIGALILAALFWATPDFPSRAVTIVQTDNAATLAVLMAALVFAGAFAAFGLLGVGERAVFDRTPGDTE